MILEIIGFICNIFKTIVNVVELTRTDVLKYNCSLVYLICSELCVAFLTTYISLTQGHLVPITYHTYHVAASRTCPSAKKERQLL